MTVSCNLNVVLESHCAAEASIASRDEALLELRNATLALLTSREAVTAAIRWCYSQPAFKDYLNLIAPQNLHAWLGQLGPIGVVELAGAIAALADNCGIDILVERFLRRHEDSKAMDVEYRSQLALHGSQCQSQACTKRILELPPLLVELPEPVLTPPTVPYVPLISMFTVRAQRKDRDTSDSDVGDQEWAVL